MKRHLLIILLFFAYTNLFSQKNEKSDRVSKWQDTSYIPVKLIDSIWESKVVSVDIGQKAIIYLKLEPILAEAKERLTNELVKDDYTTIIHFLDSASLKSDTIKMVVYNLIYFNYLVSSQLVKGNARVYYKRQKSFVDTIFHRLERYGGRADRFFYLPDKRPFFMVIELLGILDKGNPLGTGHFEAYVKEGEKLASLRQE